jgi:hypothetical protein
MLSQPRYTIRTAHVSIQLFNPTSTQHCHHHQSYRLELVINRQRQPKPQSTSRDEPIIDNDLNRPQNLQLNNLPYHPSILECCIIPRSCINVSTLLISPSHTYQRLTCIAHSEPSFRRMRVVCRSAPFVSYRGGNGIELLHPEPIQSRMLGANSALEIPLLLDKSPK